MSINVFKEVCDANLRAAKILRARLEIELRELTAKFFCIDKIKSI